MKFDFGNIVKTPDGNLGMVSEINVNGVHVLDFNTLEVRDFLPERLTFVRRSLIVNPYLNITINRT